MKATANTLLVFLELSLKEIQRLNEKRQGDGESLKTKNMLLYHLFSFTQLVYAIGERLWFDFPGQREEIKAFFGRGREDYPNEKRTDVVKRIYGLANEWKHMEAMEVVQSWRLEIIKQEPGRVSVKAVKPKVRLPVMHPLNITGNLLVDDCSDCFKQIIGFCKVNNFIPQDSFSTNP